MAANDDAASVAVTADPNCRTIGFRRQRGHRLDEQWKCAPGGRNRHRVSRRTRRRSTIGLMVAVVWAVRRNHLPSSQRFAASGGVRQCCANDGSTSVMGDRERERFVKLLGLTHSNNDGEALAALRKCNEVLKQHRLSWADVVAGRCARQSHRDTDLLDEIGRGRQRRQAKRPGSAIPNLRGFPFAGRRNFDRTGRQPKNDGRAVPYPAKYPFWFGYFSSPWATAEILAGVVASDASTSVRAMKSFGALLVLAVSSMAWLQVVHIVAVLVEAAATAAVP